MSTSAFPHFFPVHRAAFAMVSNNSEVAPAKSVSIADDTEYPVSLFQLPRCYQEDLRSVVIPEGFIRDRIRQLARDIHSVVGDKSISLLCVLKGSYRFFTALVDELNIARQDSMGLMTVDFIRTKSYENTHSTGDITIIGLSNLEELRDRHVVIVEDIVDSGVTMSKLINTIKSYGAKNVWTVVLLSKRVERTLAVPEDFVAFDIPDKFVVGYGLDYNQRFRDLNHICVLNEKAIEKYRV